MVRKVIALSLVVVMMVLGFGCASIDKTSNFNGLALTAEGKNNVAHYNAKNWGFYLLWIPLLTGDTDKVSSAGAKGLNINTTFMKDTVNLESVSDMMSRVAKGDGATILEDVNSTSMNIVFWFPLPIFFYKQVTMTGNGVK